MDGIGYPYGLLIMADQDIWMVDADTIASSNSTRTARSLAPSASLAIKLGPDQTIYVADGLNRRFLALLTPPPSGVLTRLHSIGKDVLGFNTKRRRDLTADGDSFQISLYSRHELCLMLHIHPCS
jgi:hypothetical protein